MYSINCILFLHKFQLYVSGPFPPNSRFTFDYYWSYTFFRYSLDNTKFLGVIALAWLGWPLSIPLQTLNCYVYPQRNLNLESWFALAFFIHLAKENDDVTKMKFVNLWGCFFLLILP